MKPLLIGEQNPYHTDRHFDLYPYPERSAGYRLCSIIMGLRRKTYLDSFDRRDLLHQLRWSIPDARESARRIARETIEASDSHHPCLILLGAKVTAAFGYDFHPHPSWHPKEWGDLLILPHPSGRSPFWSKPGAVREVRQILVDVLPEIPFGEIERS